MLDRNLQMPEFIDAAIAHCNSSEGFTVEDLEVCIDKLQWDGIRIHTRKNGNVYFYASFKHEGKLVKSTSTGPRLQDLVPLVVKSLCEKWLAAKLSAPSPEDSL